MISKRKIELASDKRFSIHDVKVKDDIDLEKKLNGLPDDRHVIHMHMICLVGDWWHWRIVLERRPKQ